MLKKEIVRELTPRKELINISQNDDTGYESTEMYSNRERVRQNTPDCNSLNRQMKVLSPLGINEPKVKIRQVFSARKRKESDNDDNLTS